MDAKQHDLRSELPFQPYVKRPIRFLELWRPNGWQIKVYGISARAEANDANLIDPSVLDYAKTAAATSAFANSPKSDSQGFGFLIVHQGHVANWLLLDWWVNGIWLYHQLYRSSFEQPSNFSRVESDLIACIWELKVVEFERAAWISTMIEPQDGPDVERYLDTRLTALV